MKRLLVAASLLALLVPAGAFAQQDTQTEKVTEYEFNGINIDGTRKMPLEERLEVLRRDRTQSLYETRQNWVPELLESTYKL